jgi:hypothetical protein
VREDLWRLRHVLLDQQLNIQCRIKIV